MGRSRQYDTDLPKRLHFKHGAYWYKIGNRWQRISTNKSDAIEVANALNGKFDSEALAQKWRRQVNRLDQKRKKRFSLGRCRSAEGLRVVTKWAPIAFKVIKDRAAVKNLPFDISETDVADLASSTRGVCQVSGIPFSEAKPEGCYRRPWMPSIDRIDPPKGYVNGNCRITCVAANLAMNDFGEEIFARLAHAFSKYNLP